MMNFRLLAIGIAMLPLLLLSQSATAKRGQARSEVGIPPILPYTVQVRGTALELPLDMTEYDVGPGDVFLVTVIGLEPYLVEATVSPAQNLLLPQIGSFDVAGMTAENVRKAVLDKIKRLYPTYEADCILYGIREILVSLSGAVVNPGMYNVTPLVRLGTLLKRGGNALSNSAMHRIEIHSTDGLEIVDYHRYLLDGDIEHNPRLKQGDRVVIPRGDMATEMITVRGMNVPPIYLAIRPAETVGAFLDRWYTNSSRADLSSVELYRDNGNGEQIKESYTLAEYGDVVLRAGDIVYVKRFEDVAVVGEVRAPGHYPFEPGLTVSQYLTHAGGVTSDGAKGGVKVDRERGKAKNSPDTIVEAGDVITVPRSTRAFLVGQTGMIQVVIAIFNIYLTFLAASR